MGVAVFFLGSSGIPGNMFTLAEGGFWVALYAGVFAATWAAAGLLWNGFAWRKIFIVIGALVVLLLHITHKPVVFTFFVSIGALVIAALFSKRSAIISRARNFSVLLPTIVVGTFFAIPTSARSWFIEVFAWRYLKLRGVSSIGDLQSSFGQAGSGTQGLSAGRFGIWESYFRDAISGWGLAPDGLGGAAEVFMPLHGYQPGFPAHSTVAYLAYHTGYVAAIAYVLIVGRFLYQGFRYLPTRREEVGSFKKVDIVALFAFIVGIIAVGLVGGPLKDYRLAWFFWFLVAVLAKRWELLMRP
jgi:hypothetical protein